MEIHYFTLNYLHCIHVYECISQDFLIKIYCFSICILKYSLDNVNFLTYFYLFFV